MSRCNNSIINFKYKNQLTNIIGFTGPTGTSNGIIGQQGRPDVSSQHPT